ncbi:enoyl-CoA hydratase, partial [Kitasatospora sp. NPDC059803]
MTETETYETILVERKGRVGLITLNRPKALNALNTQLMNEVVAGRARHLPGTPDRGSVFYPEGQAFERGPA